MPWTGMEDAPKRYGQYPGMTRRLARKPHFHPNSHTFQERWATYHGAQTHVQQFRNPQHPLVILTPRDQHLELFTDAHLIEHVGPDLYRGYFSSYNFFIEKEQGIFSDTDHPAFHRMASMGQLGFLIQPYALPETEDGQLAYTVPIYPHVRMMHVYIAAAMDYVILCQNGFDQEIIDQHVRAVLTHDIALPAGGDSVKRIDPVALDEERNYSEVMRASGLAKEWKKRHNFDLSRAASWVRNEGMLGFLLDVVDKMSYVMLDCYYFGWSFNGKVRRHCLKHPLFMDVWQDIWFTEDKTAFAFTNPRRLYDFVIARAYEHQELLLNPLSRTVDFDLTNLVTPLYKSGAITRKQLLSWSNQDLQWLLDHTYPPERITTGLVTPDDYQWAKFSTEAAMQEHVHSLPEGTIMNTEHIRGFDTCLHWPIFADKRRTKIVPLHACLSNRQIKRLEAIRNACMGHIVYWYTQRPR